MNLEIDKPDLIVGVVGVGTMGRGIVQVAAAGGMDVRLHDARPGAAQEARTSVIGMLQRLAEKGKMTPAEAGAAAGRIHAVETLADLSPCDVVIEVIVEQLEAKKALFAALEEVVAPQAILASNTSSLSITAIAAACTRPERVGGLHFFNPVPLMKLVEVIGGARTAPWVVEALTGLGRRMTREPVVVADSPGFLVNHIGRAYVPESLRILDEGIATASDIDRILREAAGFRMGPFQLFDMVGGDVAHPVMESLYAQFYQEPMYRPSPTARRMVEAGMLGQKTGAGFYRYDNGQAQMPDEPAPAPRPDPMPAVWISPAYPQFAATLRDALGEVPVNAALRPAPDDLCLVTPLGADMATTIAVEGLDPARTVAVDMLFGLDRRRSVMISPATAPRYRDSALSALGVGAPVTLLNDSPGFVAQRVVAMIVNVGCAIAQMGISPPSDIDLGARLGLGYVRGPLEWGDLIGPARVLEILDRLHAFYGEPRYRASGWLRRRAGFGLSLLAPERVR
ncbi:3-hydroxyacyl-CoA dehydrogenase [Xanthobacter sp. VTT E-85241]|uniref:3-hydroxyacyl-CoA dehydrogenase n=1 Tax=Roseixanthobacter finlandensis TaxID=3119922 RepID=UPI003727E2F2